MRLLHCLQLLLGGGGAKKGGGDAIERRYKKH